MANATVRITSASHEILKDLAAQRGEPMQLVLDRAIDAYARQQFLSELNTAYAALRADEVAWKQELREREDWDTTLLDGLKDD